ncbi:hypothetical protein BDN72DRAFT_964982 [Pluteus cervinus]|uniref:Uncharacterized protein n=1 Tax=Pluteus cervinus TaxID=181527 RepID=A0ACD3A7V6_9AGAR|nr:hypothetical protein BDN72DRAFT_964982 [Pluteus cervinus]
MTSDLESESPQNNLPEDILEEIFSSVELHTDLVNLACVCRAFSLSIIPRHTEYRIIQTRQPIPHVWAHLARRQDLARNIRKISFSLPRPLGKNPTRLPNTLLDNLLDKQQGTRDQLVNAQNMYKALEYMTHLKEFIWLWTPEPIVAPPYQRLVLSALAKRSSLERLSLFTIHGPDRSPHNPQDPNLEENIDWRLINLRRLSLSGRGWAHSHLLGLFQPSSTIQLLDVPGDIFRHNFLASTFIPTLATITINSSLIIDVNTAISLFLKNHPSIQSLVWTSSGPIVLISGSLPNLRHVRCCVEFISALEDSHQSSPSALREIVQLDAPIKISRLSLLTFLDGSALEGFRASAFASVEELLVMADLFPNIEWLSLPSRERSTSDTGLLSEWHNVLSNFRKLKRFHDISVSLGLEFDDPKIAELVLRLAQICPTLETIIGKFCHGTSPSTIKIKREADFNPKGEVISQKERISYEISDNKSIRYLSKKLRMVPHLEALRLHA